jgi:hypothetical protein
MSTLLYRALRLAQALVELSPQWIQRVFACALPCVVIITSAGGGIASGLTISERGRPRSHPTATSTQSRKQHQHKQTQNQTNKTAAHRSARRDNTLRLARRGARSSLEASSHSAPPPQSTGDVAPLPAAVVQCAGLFVNAQPTQRSLRPSTQCCAVHTMLCQLASHVQQQQQQQQRRRRRQQHTGSMPM